MQTAIMKPKSETGKSVIYLLRATYRSGPGVPPAIISGKIAAGLLQKELKIYNNEATV
jgi:phytoene desaturase